MNGSPMYRNERGVALVVVLLVVLAVAAIAAGAALLSSSTGLIDKYHTRLSTLETAADAGIEEVRSAVNANKTIYPDTGFRTIENGVAVYDAGGAVIPGLKRWSYLGPIGATSGQYGVYGSVVTVVQDAQGNNVVRRGEIFQESFAKYAYFTNVEGSIQFAAGDQLFGPVHSNDKINIASGSPGPTFWGPLVTAKTISNRSNGNYKQGYTENGPTIPFPQTADLSKLQSQATAGNMAFVSTTSGLAGQATTRIEFTARDLNGDGDSTDDNEGFIKVYQVTNAANVWWVMADTNSYGAASPNGGVRNSPNCGHVNTNAATSNHPAGGFVTFEDHATAPAIAADNKANAPGQTGAGIVRRCYLGGSDSLYGASAFGAAKQFPTNGVGDDARGRWLPWPGAVSPLIPASNRDRAYLWPISRTLNPNYKGVIYVTGKVAISGRVRGQTTLAASDNIIIADDLTYMTNPGSSVQCNATARDMLGLFSGTDVVVADNLINDPIAGIPGGSNVTWDETPDEFIHAVILALSNFTVENYNQGPTNFESCGGTAWGRGCLFLTGGVIQYQRGAVGTTGGTGNLKRYSYDACAAANPPPYFPTTGHFARGHYYEVEPTGFNISTYWALLH